MSVSFSGRGYDPYCSSQRRSKHSDPSAGTRGYIPYTNTPARPLVSQSSSTVAHQEAGNEHVPSGHEEQGDSYQTAREAAPEAIRIQNLRANAGKSLYTDSELQKHLLGKLRKQAFSNHNNNMKGSGGRNKHPELEIPLPGKGQNQYARPNTPIQEFLDSLDQT